MGKIPVMSIRELSKCFRNQSLDPRNIIEDALHKAQQELKILNVFITVTSDEALRKSEESFQRHKMGKPLSILDGVPIAVKDNFCTKGIRTTCASKMLQEFTPTYNATVYEKLERMGAILIGKTNMDQFGMGSGTIDSIFGPTKNVWSKCQDDWNIVGGSSGGSASAVAANICYGALGSDTGGSTRNPASYCGVVGLKPTYGLLSRNGLIPLVNSMDVPGILTRSVDDALIFLNALAGPDVLDSTTIKRDFRPIEIPTQSLTKLSDVRVGIPQEYFCDGLSKEVHEIWMKVADAIEDAGASVHIVSMPNTASSIFVYSILNQCEVASNMARYDGIEFGHRADEESSTEELYARSRAEGFNGVVKNRILAGNYFLLRRNYDKYFEKALQVRRLIANDFQDVFQKVDVILTPTTLTDAPKFTDFSRSNNRDQCAVQDFCTQPANMAGVPAVSVPICLSTNGLPLSLQIMGDSMSEALILRVAQFIEKQVKFIHFDNY